MRLICPNCGAQYEVDSKVIPDGGRDVQCSSCGNTWFQRPAHMDEDLADELEVPFEPETEDTGASHGAEPEHEAPHEDEAEPEHEAEPEVEPELERTATAAVAAAASAAATAAAVSGGGAQEDASSWFGGAPTPAPTSEEYEDEDDVEDYIPDAEPEPEPEPEPAHDAPELEAEPEHEAQPTAPPRQELGDDVKNILREEAERETRARGSEMASGLETQTEMGLEEDDAQRSSGVRERMARLRGEEAPDPTEAAIAAAVASGNRRDLLPDIDEINSTLRNSAERVGDELEIEPEQYETQKRGGFRLGFGLVLGLLALAILVYLFAPMIASMIPGAEKPLAGYVDAVNSLRVWLDTTLESSMIRLTNILSQLSGTESPINK